MPAPVQITTLTLSLTGTPYEYQCSNARLETTNTENKVQTFGGTYTSSTESHTLTLEGFQDYGADDSLCDLLWAASESGTDIAAIMVLNGESFTCSVSGRKPPVGGAAGVALPFTVTLPVQGSITVTAPTP
jgi:hypothetical protein